MGLVPARRPGWLLEGRSNPSPRGMAAHPPWPWRGWRTEPGLQTLWHSPSDGTVPRPTIAGARPGRQLDREDLWLVRRDRWAGGVPSGEGTAPRAHARRPVSV